ncbi:Aspyridones efflux protein apdF [Colletotrichum trifolii]|uniref:Aspyridones efflux protein apdF n=1 Tax=Colletotrichum trifolii TaxID=5466 RepID=A0A4R8QNX7_COLTR|nr:Aspyridones efflux protein apdF [Colletotrichum trifolii]
MTSLSETYWQILLSQGFCTGIGLGLMFMPTISVISSYFKKRRAIALTISASGTGVGGTAFPATVQYLTPKIGFPWAVRCSGFLALLLVVVMSGLLKPRLAPRKSGPLAEWAAFKEPKYVLFSCGCFFYFWALYFGFFYINSYARDVIGFSSVSSVNLVLVTNAVGIPARPIVGWIADKYVGPVNTFIILVASVSVLLYAWIAIKDTASMYAFSAIYGTAVSASQGMFVSSLASLTKDPRKMGTRFGMVCTILAFATLAGPPTAGAIIDRADGRYLYAQIWGGTVMVLCAVMIVAARVWGTGFKLLVKC